MSHKITIFHVQGPKCLVDFIVYVNEMSLYMFYLGWEIMWQVFEPERVIGLILDCNLHSRLCCNQWILSIRLANSKIAAVWAHHT